ncbi:MAG: hypothetical protein ACJ76P_10540 [Actinomycetota bacterium]
MITFRLEEESSSLLAHSVDGLFQWRQPGRPEDLSLLLADGAPWLTSIAHEEMAWIDGDEAMRLALQEAGLAVQADG